ncbi:MAG: dienelactone hydrolase family protein [Alphaproteobacteria bacterium]|nr:dienelactone hydrolase family protein [Alphaproteobacteria bacterium]
MPGDIRPSAKLSPDLKSQLASLAPDAPLSRRGFVVTSLSAGFAAAAMPVCAQTVITTDAKGLVAGEVKIPVPDGSIPGYRARPADNKKHAVVLVVQEIFGVHEHIKDVCRRFAKAGYYAIAPELYSRQGDPSKISDIPTLLSQIVSKVPDKQVMADLDAAAAVAAKSGHADASKLAVTGFCWGGRIVWLYAAHNPKLKAGVAWYGPIARPATELQPKNPIDLAADIKAPVLGLYGGADQGIPNDTVEKMQAALKAAKKPSEIVLYPDTPHGFHADYRPSYRKDKAEDGWAKALAWFKKNGVA